MKMGSLRKIEIGILLIVMVLAVQSNAAVPKLITYEGRLTDSNGDPVTGTKSIVFKIYTQVSGGASVWNETQSVILDSKGFYTVILGSVSALNLTFDTDCWLGINVAGDGEMTPRYRLTSVSSAINADRVDGLHAADIPGSGDMSKTTYDVNANDTADNCESLGGAAPGNASGNIPISNGTVCTNLNADKVDGSDASAFASASHNHDGGYLKIGETNEVTQETWLKMTQTAGISALRIDKNGAGRALTVFSNGAGEAGIYAHHYFGGPAIIAGTTPGNIALQVNQNADITGTLTKGAGSFLIDHPLDPKNKILRHSFVESPEMMLVYKGRAKLRDRIATITLPDYFDALNHHEDREIALTCINGWSPLYLEGKIEGNKFVVKTTSEGNHEQEFSWVIYAVRNDAFVKKNPMVVEQEKGVDNRYKKGEYIHADAFRQVDQEDKTQHAER